MKLIYEADDIPKNLIDALENDKLVIFAGAGVSKPHPSNLPIFKDLAEDLAKGTDITINETYIDKDLGKLSDKHKDKPYYIHQQIIEKFQNVISPNDLHRDILKLFKKNIKIVTTNFDNLFNIAAKEENIALKTFYAPALPLGDDFEGIVYLHGNILDKAEHLVVTDKDFSQAYICRGWATEFIKEVFRNYTVLFIGYSYNDTILQYLTRGIVSNNLYALTDNNSNDWENLGINAIKYNNPDNKHSNLKLLLDKIIETYCCDITSEIDKIEQFANTNPKYIDELQIDVLKNKIMTDDWRIGHLLDNISESIQENWLLFFFESGYLKPLFTATLNDKWDKVSEKLCTWFVYNFTDNEAFYNFNRYSEDRGIVTKILKHYHYKISDNLAGCLSKKFSEKIENEQIYSVFLESILNSNIGKLDKYIYLTLQLNICINKDYTNSVKLLLHHLLKTKYNYETNQIEHNAYDYYFEEIYKLKPEKLYNYYQTLLSIIPSEIEKTLSFRNNTNNDEQINSYYIRDIENCGQDSDKYCSDKNLVDLIILLKTSFDKLISDNMIVLAKSYAIQWLNSDSYILNRIGIYCLYSNKILSSNQVLDLFIKHNWLTNRLYFKHEVRHYFKLNYRFLTDKYKLKMYNKLKQHSNTENEYIDVMRFLRYVKSNNINTCELLEKQFTEICSKITIPIDQIPEDLDSYWSNEIAGGFVEYQCDYEVNDILNMNPEDETDLQILSTAKGYEIVEGEKWGNSRDSVLFKIEDAIVTSYPWGLKLITVLINRKDYKCDLYEAIFRGLDKLDIDNINIENIINALVFFDKNINYEYLNDNIIYSYINLIYKITKADYKLFAEINILDTLLDILHNLWSKLHNKDNEINQDVLNQAINNCYGIIVESIINIIGIEFKLNNENKDIFNKYKEFFEKEIINKNNFKSKIGLSILSSRIYYLFYLNQDWTVANLISQIDSKANYGIVWNSFSYANPSFPKSFIQVLLPHFNNIISHKNQYKNMLHSEKFYQMYLVMFLHSLLFYKDILKDFNLDLAIDSMENNEIHNFYNSLSNNLSNSNIIDKFDIVEDWLWDFWENRLNCTTNNTEKSASLDLIFSLNKYFPKCYEIIKTTEYTNINWFILYQLKNSDIISNFPKETILFLNHIVNDKTIDDIKYHDSDLKDIIQKCMDEKIILPELKDLLEKIIRANISWGIKLLKEYNGIAN